MDASDSTDNRTRSWAQDIMEDNLCDFKRDWSPNELRKLYRQSIKDLAGVSDAGIKYDEDKPRMELLDSYALEQLAKVLTFGANKYGEFNWCKGIQYLRLLGAALRHIYAFIAREDLDPESGLPHIAHAMANLMFLLGMSQIHPELDNRRE